MKKQYFFALLLTLLCLTFSFSVSAEEKPYTIDVNLEQNIVTIYTQDEFGEYSIADRAFICSVGPDTPTGTYYTSSKYEWRPLFGNVYGQYATRITGSILFHSVPYLKQDKSTLEWWEYNQLGESVSMGCVRLTVEDVKWIYDNCPSGTQVHMYYSSEPEPIEPNAPQILDENDINNGWDPTDPDTNNPWISEELISTTLPIFGFNKEVTLYHKGDFYGLNASNAKLIWGLMGTPLLLPSDLISEDSFGEVSIFHNTISNTVSYYRNNNILYYSIVDLVSFTDTTFSFDEDAYVFTKDTGKSISIYPRTIY